MGYREICIFVTGTTPQIITETLYALHHLPASVNPDEICILTTTTGREVAERELLRGGRLQAFYEEFGITPVTPEIILIADESGTPLADIKSARDNEYVGDFIASFIRERALDDGARLHCSIAGGRKTMSFYLGAALSLVGRPWDRLYHVLITPEFESHPDFYWKPKEEQVLEIKSRDGGAPRRLNTGDAEITLAELPFIRFKGRFSIEGRSFRELVAEGQREIDTASVQLPLTVNLGERTVTIGSTTIEMVPMQIIIYNAFLREKCNRCRYPERECCLDCTDCFPHLVDLSGTRVLKEMADDYRMAYGSNRWKGEEFLKHWKDGVDVETLRQHRSKINRVIKEHLKDETLATFYTIAAVGRHGNKRHGVKVEKGKIRMEA